MSYSTKPLSEPTRFQILGTPRSGTTFLRNVLNSLDGVSCHQELDLIGTVWEQKQPLYEVLWHELKPWFLKLPDVERNRYALRFMTQLIDQPGCHACGNKDTTIREEHISRADMWFSQGKLVTIMRNPYDWAVSYANLAYTKWKAGIFKMTMHPFWRADFTQIKAFFEAGAESMFRPSKVRDLAFLWRALNIRFEELAEDDHVLHLHYANLYEQPLQTFELVLAHLGISYDHTQLVEVLADKRKPGNVQVKQNAPELGKHKQKLLSWEIEAIEEVTEVDSKTLRW